MEPKRSKYDTNPLDEDVGRRAEDSFGSTRSAAQTEDISGPTKPVNRAAPDTARAPGLSEEPTRLIHDKVTSYPSVFVPPPPRHSTYEPPRVSSADIYQPPPGAPPNLYQPPPVPVFTKPGMHKIEGLGIPERWAAILPYMPFSWLGIVIALVELFLTPRTETRVRFHASQALALHLAVAALTTLLSFIGLITNSRFTGAGLLGSAAVVFLLVAIVKVWKGNPFVIGPLDEPRKWLDEKIKPRK